MADAIITAAAEADYLEGLCWYANRTQRAAEGFEAEFDRSLKDIASDPERFARCNARHRRLLMRRYPYQIVYRIENRGEQTLIVVIAVAHAKRRPAYWKGR